MKPYCLYKLFLFLWCMCVCACAWVPCAVGAWACAEKSRVQLAGFSCHQSWWPNSSHRSAWWLFLFAEPSHWSPHLLTLFLMNKASPVTHLLFLPLPGSYLRQIPNPDRFPEAAGVHRATRRFPGFQSHKSWNLRLHQADSLLSEDHTLYPVFVWSPGVLHSYGTFLRSPACLSLRGGHLFVLFSQLIYKPAFVQKIILLEHSLFLGHQSPEI